MPNVFKVCFLDSGPFMWKTPHTHQKISGPEFVLLFLAETRPQQ